MIKNSWYSKAKILGIERVTPIQMVVTGVKKKIKVIMKVLLIYMAQMDLMENMLILILE